MGTWDSISLSLVVPLAQAVWLKIYEEKELLQRLGEDYVKYMMQVGPLFVYPRLWPRFIHLLLTGKDKNQCL